MLSFQALTIMPGLRILKIILPTVAKLQQEIFFGLIFPFSNFWLVSVTFGVGTKNTFLKQIEMEFFR